MILNELFIDIGESKDFWIKGIPNPSPNIFRIYFTKESKYLSEIVFISYY